MCSLDVGYETPDRQVDGVISQRQGEAALIRFGLVGVNTSHASVFAGIFNGSAETGPALEGGRVVAVWGDAKADAEELAAKHNIVKIVDDPAAMIGEIDAVLVVDDTGGGATHARLARPFIEAGLPTFIDKPMTLEIGGAIALFDLAERYGAPLMSSSALRFAAEVAELKDRLPEVGQLSSLVSVGPGDWYYYGVHAVELYQTILGTGAQWVQCHALDRRDIVVVGYDGGATAVVETLRDARYVFHLVVYGATGWAQCEVTDHQAFYRNLMVAVLKMAQTGEAPVSRAQTLDVLGVLHAGLRSAETGQRAYLCDILRS
jgi:predicted dehydrogenase